MLKAFRNRLSKGRRPDPRRNIGMPEVTQDERALVDEFAPYTMNPAILQWGLLKSLQYVQQRGIPGAIVECGVWRGGNMLLAAKAVRDRDIWLYDTFAGMTAPTEHDRKTGGADARPKFEAQQKDGYNEWCFASLGEVTGNFETHGLLSDRVKFVKGPVEQTLSGPDMPAQIALLRLDTDWYESVKACLEALYPRLSQGGVLILDDYGSWQGARKAVDEYFADKPAPLLIPIEQACRMAIKV